MIKRYLLIQFINISCALLVSSNINAEEIVKIVSSLPRTGSVNAQTTGVVNGITMAIDEVKGKVGKFKVEYEDWDDASPERGQWDPAVEASNADKAIKNQDVLAYIGTYNSGAAKISMPKLNLAGLLMVSPANTWPGLTKKGIGEANEPMVYRPSGVVTYFRIVPTDELQGAVAAKWAAELGAKKVYLLHDRELYGRGIAEMFKRSATKNGIEVVAFEGIDAKASNYRSLMVKIKQKAADLLYFGGTTQTSAGQIAKDLRASGSKIPYMVPDGCFETAFIKAAGSENLEGMTYITFGGVPANQLQGKGREFYQKYKAKFGTEPEAFAAYGYESASVVLHALSKIGSKDRAKLIKAVSEIKEFDGLLGKWSFDENGDTTLRTMSGNIVKNGHFEFSKILNN